MLAARPVLVEPTAVPVVVVVAAADRVLVAAAVPVLVAARLVGERPAAVWPARVLVAAVARWLAQALVPVVVARWLALALVPVVVLLVVGRWRPLLRLVGRPLPRAGRLRRWRPR